jgi:hypothetical protein
VGDLEFNQQCTCGQPVSHKRYRLCSNCYKDKRKQDWKINEQIRRANDPDRVRKISEAKSNKYKELKVLRPKVPKKCACGNVALKGSRRVLCETCSKENRRTKKIKYQNNRKKTHTPSKIRENIKSRLKRALKSNKSMSIVEYLGCSMDFYIKYLESKFLPGMTWENYGINGWHIDHIIPLSTDYSNLDLHNYKNTQPIWENDHLLKTSQENKREGT